MGFDDIERQTNVLLVRVFFIGCVHSNNNTEYLHLQLLKKSNTVLKAAAYVGQQTSEARSKGKDELKGQRMVLKLEMRGRARALRLRHIV